MNKIKNVIILAGGESSRLFPLSDKNLIEFLGRPLILYQLEKFAPMAEKLIIVTNSRSKSKIETLARPFNAIVVEQKGEGQAAALLSAGTIEGDMLVVNGSDIFEDFLYDRISVEIEAIKGDGFFAAVSLKDYFPGGILKIKDRQVLEVVEKPGKDAMPSNMMKMVVDYYKDAKSFLQAVAQTETDRDDRYEKAISRYVASGKTIEFFEYDGIWTTLKHPWDVLRMKNYFLSKIKEYRGEHVEVHPTAIIHGEVYLEAGVRVSEYAKIVGPSYIGKNTIVGNYTLVVESMIGEDSIIGGYCEVTRSYLGNHVWLHRNYVGDSVLENNILFGAGALAANFRFDEKNIHSPVKGQKTDSGLVKLGAMIGSNVKVGVNASLMPGVKIASGQTVSPGQVLKHDLV